MSGHSHWSGIKHKKGIADARRGKLFSKLARTIITAAKAGGGDPEMNLTLKYAIDAAKAANMPKDNIARAIKKGTGDVAGVSYEELIYEGYGPGGIALLVETLTDSRNRTSSEMRYIFDRRGGNLGATGCVAWMFDTKALFLVEEGAIDEEKLMDIAIDGGAENVELIGEVYEITADPALFSQVKKALEEAGVETQVAEIAKIPQNRIHVEDAAAARKLLALIEALEDQDDVQNVSANFDISDEILEDINTAG
jgi:YebC/PmpR family DNA-binding regulatory protein